MASSLVEILATMRVQDVLDILLNSYLLFRLYFLLRGTRLLRIATVIAGLIFLQRVVEASGMIITQTVLQYFTALIAIGVLIVFRYEIRSLFQSKSISDVLWRISEKPVPTPVEIIAEAAFRLARKRIGALMVFAGRQSLEAHIQGGVPWFGQISREMLESVFWPGNPVHDGAAIIGGNFVQRVGAILPLSDRENLPSRYGTRHRAAIGMTEMSDAMVLIVSEEQGIVEIAEGGKIETVHYHRQMQEKLRKHQGMGGVSPAERRRTDRWTAAMAGSLSLLLVSGIWFSLSQGVIRSLTTVEAPVEYIKNDPNTEIMETSATSVKLQLSGSRGLINALGPNQVKVRFDLNRARAGKNTFVIREEDILLPHGIHVKKIDPPQVDIFLDIIGRKSLPVQVDWTGKLPANIVIEEVRVTPASLEVSGGQEILDQLQTIYTVKVPVNDIRQSGEASVAVVLRPASVKLTARQPANVLVSYKVKLR
jgi:diadenylate cyclase